MKIAFLGDSITYGYALEDRTKRYSTVLCEMLGVTEENYGITGTLIAKAGLNNEDGKDFVTRLPLIYEADVAVIFGGTNDYFWSDKPIECEGEPSDKYFASAFETVCKLVKENRGDKPTLIVTPYAHNGVGNFEGGAHFRDSSRHDTDAVNYNGARLIDYVNTMVKIAEREGLPCLNLHENFPFDHKIHTSDGCHPNEAGHVMLAERIAEALKAIILHGSIPMKFTVDHDIHIHSGLSACSRDPEQTAESILEYARESGLSYICVTDHYWDRAVPGASNWYKPQDYDHVAKILPLPYDGNVRFLFGAETDLRFDGTLGMPRERFDDFDFVIIPTTHLHMRGFAIAERDADSNRRRAELWVSRLDMLFDMDLPWHKIGIAHLACSLIEKSSRESYLEVLDLIPSSEMERVFKKAAKLGCGIELNRYDMEFSEAETERVLRMFRIAKACDCKFYLGTDAHHPKDFDGARATFERAIDLLGLTEDDKFIPEA